MYGLVNKAIQDLVCDKFGEDKWAEIKKLSNFEDDFFIGLQSYPDALTYTLVHNASKVLGADASVVLKPLVNIGFYIQQKKDTAKCLI